MKLELSKPIKALNKAYLKEKVSRDHIELFKKNLQLLVNRINEQESEEHLKNVIADFLKDTWYKEQFEINTKDRNDLVIHTGKTTKEPVGVILEVKRPSNKSEMMSEAKPNSKALQELILYYLRERFDHNNTDIKYLVVTNIYEWYIIDEVWFEKNVFRNSKLKKDYENWKLSGKDTKFFYDSIAKSFLDDITEEMPAAYFDVRTYEKYIANADKEDDTKLIGLYKILSPAHLLKQPFLNDSNSLDTKFYTELLHIIGLEEIKDGGKKLIKRKAKSDEASLLENTIIKLEDKDALRNINNLSTFGANKDERLFNVALELCITWVNRVLFIKLLEAQLYKYHKGNKDYLFLNSKLIHDFDELSNLFFQVLAEKPGSRRNHIQEKFNKVPYLNSSLFERTELERQTINVSELDNRLQLPLSASTVLKDDKGKRKTGSLPTLQYLFEFLDAYDFTSEGGEEIQEENKNLINASVLGLIFEKINGYKDGSFFTPGFVTMYMCKETIRRSVLQKFNETKGWQCDTLDGLYNKIDDKKEANKIINNLHICDPAVGSGHFLVSALNEIIAVKSELKILQDAAGKSLRDYHVEVVNDELIITDEDGKLFDYNPQNKESQRIQETLFHEKETIIENCLFGVDINPNSVKICRLRLWIELLKNAYYKIESNYTELETLPNIDINIKCGNSLISRFRLDADLKPVLKKFNYTIPEYRSAVQTYRRAQSKEEKRELEDLINKIKNDLQTGIGRESKQYKELSKLESKYFKLYGGQLFDEKISKKEILARNEMSDLIAKKKAEIEDIKNNKIYENAFEWRFEFPEVLNQDGDFIGFDIIIGNPPYGVKAREDEKKYFKSTYESILGKYDSYGFFIELSLSIIKIDGQFALIIPHTWLTVKEAATVRDLIYSKSKILEIDQLPSNVFADAVVETTNLFLQKKDNPSKDYHVKVLLFDLAKTFTSMDTFKLQNIISVDSLYKGGVFNLRSGDKGDLILQRIKSGAVLLKDLFDLSVGVQAYDKYAGQTKDIIENRIYHASFKKDKTFVEEVNGSDIKRYFISRPKTSYISYGNWLAHPRSKKYFDQKRILIREITSKGRHKIIASIIEEYTINYKSVLNIVNMDKDTKAPSLEFLIALINSTLFSWIFSKTANKLVTDTFPRISLHDLKNFPIKIPGKKEEEEIVRIVSSIYLHKINDHKIDTSELENKIDDLVYKLYGITTDEIEIIEEI